MAIPLECGFFNGEDRSYDAVDISKLFDGLITDGVYMTIGNRFLVTTRGVSGGLHSYIAAGKAWFLHTWAYIEESESIEHDSADVLFDRWDAVILDFNTVNSVRNVYLDIVKGIPSQDPQKPTVLNNGVDRRQVVVAYVKIRKNATQIYESDIEIIVGQVQTPYITGVVSTMNISELIARWDAEWSEWKNDEIASYELWRTAYEASANQFMTMSEDEFNTWFAAIKGQLSEDAAGHLQNEIDELLANMNLQFSGVASEIMDINSKINKSKLENTTCLLFGDSMNTGSGWGYYFRQLSGATCDISGQGSAGYTKAGSQGRTFQSQLQSYLQTKSTAEKEAYDYLIVGGGANDYDASESTLSTAVTNFITYAKSQLPNAKIFLWVNHTFAIVDANLLNLYNTIYDTAIKLKINVSSDLMRLPIDHKLEWDSDGVHMTTIGYQEYAANIINALQGNSILKPIPFELYAISGRGSFGEQYNTICGGKIQINSRFVIGTIPGGTVSFFSNIYAQVYNLVYFPCMTFRTGYAKSIAIKNDGLFRMGIDAGASLITNENVYINMTYDWFS